MCEHQDFDELDIGGLLDVAEAALRRISKLPLGGAVADVALTRCVQRLEAVTRVAQGNKFALVAEIAQRQAHRGQGSRATEDLLASVLHLSRGEAKTQTELAAGLELVPDTAAALRDGRIGVGQAAVTVRKADEVKDRDDGEQLVKQIDATAASAGQTMDRTRLARTLDEVVHADAPDVLGDRVRLAQRRRGVWFGERDGVPSMDVRLPVEGMAAVRAALDALGKPDGSKDPRTVAQRHCDALVALAVRYLDEGKLPDVAAQRPHVLLITTPEALHGEDDAAPSLLDGHGPVGADLARQICCDARITAVLTDQNGAVLDAKPLRPSPTRRQRAAVIARDKQCVGCGAPVSHCEVHHIVWRRHKGRTLVANLVLVCWNCHTHIHHHGWQVTVDASGRYHAGPLTHLDNSIEQSGHAHSH